MPTSASTLKFVRQLHLYFGVFISPAILFFAFTGALQTFSLHETTRGSDYKPPAWAVTLAQIHKKATTIVPVRRAGLPPDRTDKPRAESAPDPNAARAGNATAVVPPAPAPKPKSHLPLKIFFLVVSVGLFSSTLTGIYMSYKYNSNKLVVTALLVAGVVLPLALLPF